MSEKQKIEENTFDMGIAGGAGAVSTAAGWGTFASPDVRQNPENFANSNNNKALGSTSNLATGTPADPNALDATIDQIYSKEVTPSPDEVMTGLKYEMQNMIKKDKARAKEVVLSNLKRDPHFYGALHMLNISDKDMMKETRKKQISDALEQTRIRLKNR